jgi:hypothetical protein
MKTVGTKSSSEFGTRRAGPTSLTRFGHWALRSTCQARPASFCLQSGGGVGWAPYHLACSETFERTQYLTFAPDRTRRSGFVCAAHRRTTVCAGSVEGNSGRSAGCAGNSARQQHQLRVGKEHNHSRAQQAKRTRAFRHAQSIFFPEAQLTSDPSGTQRRVCSLWVRAPG